MLRSITYYAPASAGNLSVGFDLLGLAIQPVDGSLLGDQVTIESVSNSTADRRIQIQGNYASSLPSDPNQNVVARCMDLFLAELGIADSQGIQIKLNKALPVGSGLGSSASSVVATLCALNEWFRKPLDETRLLHLMAKAESGISGSIHYDNIAPCFHGGLILCDPESPMVHKLPWPQDWYIVVGYRNHSVRTQDARDVLPNAYSRRDLIQQSSTMAKFVHGLHTGNLYLSAQNMVDLIAEPYRLKLIPECDTSLQFMRDHGALAVGISGSGPTIYAIVNELERGRELVQWLESNYSRDGFARLCAVDTQGARQITGDSK